MRKKIGITQDTWDKIKRIYIGSDISLAKLHKRIKESKWKCRTPSLEGIRKRSKREKWGEEKRKSNIIRGKTELGTNEGTDELIKTMFKDENVDERILRVLHANCEYETRYAVSLMRWAIDYLEEREQYITEYNKDGSVKLEKTIFVPNPPLTLNEWARENYISMKQVREWSKKYPEFEEAYFYAQNKRKEMIQRQASIGGYNNQFSQFLLLNDPEKEFKDQKHIDHTTKGESMTHYNGMTDEDLQSQAKSKFSVLTQKKAS